MTARLTANQPIENVYVAEMEFVPAAAYHYLTTTTDQQLWPLLALTRKNRMKLGVRNSALGGKGVT